MYIDLTTLNTNFHSSFFLNRCLKATGIMLTNPSAISNMNWRGDTASLALVKVCRVFPACIASKDGGATPDDE